MCVHQCGTSLLKIMKRFIFLLVFALIYKYMALNVMELCRTRALLTRSKITPEIGLARLAALYKMLLLHDIQFVKKAWYGSY